MSGANKFVVPIGFIHKVDMNRVQAAIEPQGKNGAMVLTSKTDAGVAGGPTVINTTDRVKTYVSKPDFAAEWDSTCPVYEAVCKEFDGGANPVHVGFYDDAADITAELQTIIDCQPNFYTITTPDLVDDPRQVDVGVLIDGYDPRYFYVANTNVADAYQNGAIGEAMVAAGLMTTALFYSDGCDVASELSGQVSAFDLDVSKPPNIYSMQATGNCPPVNLAGGVSELQTLLDNNINVKVCVGNNVDNLPVYLAGKTIAGGRINDCILSCWLQSRAQEALFNLDLETQGAQDSTEEGYQAKINAVSAVFRTAQRRGLITGDRFNTVEDREIGYRIVAPAFADLPAGAFTSGLPFCFSVETYSAGAQEGSCLEIKLFL